MFFDTANVNEGRKQIKKKMSASPDTVVTQEAAADYVRRHQHGELRESLRTGNSMTPSMVAMEEEL